jgi:hypothetical protein
MEKPRAHNTAEQFGSDPARHAYPSKAPRLPRLDSHKHECES